MWNALEKIAWSKLQHNYGDAADIPGHLRACTHHDVDRVAEALGEVDNLLFHQGGWVCSASSAALPFLIDLAAGKAKHHRDVLVELIGRLAREAVTVESRLVDAGWQPALNASRGPLLALLEDPDPRVRREATLLAGDGIRHPDAVEALRRRWLVETDRVTRWDLVLALGTACSWVEDVGVLRAELGRLLEHDDLQVRLAAVHALSEDTPAAAVPHVETLVQAVLHDDADLWQQSAWIGGTRTTITTCTGALLRADPVVATAYTIGVSRGGEVRQRVATMEQAGRLLAEWRTVTGAVLPFLAENLGDPEAEVRYRAAFLLACLGAQAATSADLLTARLDDRALRDSHRQVTVGDAVVWALARLHDPRCIPGLVERLTGHRLGFDTAARYFGRDMHLLCQPGMHEVLIPLRQQAPTLIEAVAARLMASEGDRVLVLNLCAVVEQWGPAAAAALPAVAQLIEREDVFAAAVRALGGIGPAASAVTRPLTARADEPDVAWALWRTAAAPELGARQLIRHVAENPRHPHGVRLLADLGSQAAECADCLREMTRSGDDWVRVEAAHALWRVCGDPAAPVAVLTELAGPLAEGQCLPVRLAAMRYLAAIGSPGAATTGIAQAIADNPRRVAYSGGWRIFTEDEELRSAAARLLVQS